MIRKLLGAFAALCVAAAAHASDVVPLETQPDIDRWGFDVAFGQASYMESVTRFSVLSPYVLGNPERGTGWRVALDLVAKDLTPVDESFGEISLGLEQNSRIYKDIAYSYVRFALGAAMPEDQLYDGTIFTVPVTLGAQIITQNTNLSVLSFFFEYRFTAYADYEKSKSLPGTNSYLKEEVLFPGITSVGLRLLF